MDIEEKYKEYGASGLLFVFVFMTTAALYLVSFWRPSIYIRYGVIFVVYSMQYAFGLYAGMTKEKSLSWHPERTPKIRLIQTVVNCVLVTIGLILSMWLWCWSS